MVDKLWNLFETILRTVMNFLLDVIGKQMDESQWQEFLQFIKFCMVGVSNTAISLTVYYIFVIINKDLYIVGNAVGFVVSVLNSYYWNSRYVFHKKDEQAKTLAKTFGAYSTTLVLGTVLLYVFVEWMHISEFIAPLVNLIVTIPINFLLNKIWVMK